jgi:hypothetical protein
MRASTGARSRLIAHRAQHAARRHAVAAHAIDAAGVFTGLVGAGDGQAATLFGGVDACFLAVQRGLIMFVAWRFIASCRGRIGC